MSEAEGVEWGTSKDIPRASGGFRFWLLTLFGCRTLCISIVVLPGLLSAVSTSEGGCGTFAVKVLVSWEGHGLYWGSAKGV